VGADSGLVDAATGDGLCARYGPGWVDSLPALVAQVTAARGLSVLCPLTGGRTACVLKVRRGNHLAVLKLAPDLARSRREEAALRAYAAVGLAPEVLEADEGAVDGVSYHLMLLAFVPGGGSLRECPAPADAIPALGRLLAGLRDCSATPLTVALPSLADHVYAGLGRAAGGGLHGAAAPTPADVRLAAGLLGELNATTPADHWVHGTLHPGNVLTDGLGRLLAIDPRPFAGDLDYDVAESALKLGSELAGRTTWPTAAPPRPI